MGRKKSEVVAESHELTEAQTQGLAKAAESANQMALMQHQYNDERDLANQLLGQTQMAFAVSKLTTVVGLTKLAHIKETKMYKAFAGKTVVLPSGENRRLVGTWDEYCDLLGTSRQKVDEDLINLRAFGEDAMDNLTRIGAGYRELRQLRKLPEDQQAALIEVAKLGDKESFVDLAEEIIAKHAKEKETLTKELADANDNYEAQGAVIQKKDEKLNSLEKQLHKQRNRAGDWHPRASDIAIETTRHAAATLEGLDKLSEMRDAILNEDFGEADREAAIEAMAVVYYDAVTQIVNRIAEVTDACDEVFIGFKEKARPMLDVEAFLSKAGK
ncbi:MAG: hypothetical protein WC825_07055 [Gallionellaceae bacterium]|jgi:hypothetical protein